MITKPREEGRDQEPLLYQVVVEYLAICFIASSKSSLGLSRSRSRSRGGNRSRSSFGRSRS